VIDEDASVPTLTEDASASINHVTNLYEQDDIWFGGQTKTLNLQLGCSNGSSAGSASATADWYLLPLVQKPILL
jgi:hypothetical protein